MPSQTLIAQIAGRDSVAAAVAAVREHGFARVVPTIAYAGTETGDHEAPMRAIDHLRGLLGETAELADPVTLQDPALWAALNGRPAAEIRRHYGIFSPCMACHLYFHLVRVPLAWNLGQAAVSSGDRDTHDGRLKLSQTAGSIDASIRVLAHAGIELLEPVRMASGADIESLVGPGWSEGDAQLSCLLSGNFSLLDGTVPMDEPGYRRYLQEFFEPVGRAVIDAWRDDASFSDYWSLVRGVLETQAG